MKKSGLIMGLIVVLVVGAVVGLALLLKAVSPEKIAPNPNIKGDKVYVRPDSYMTGKADAKVTLVEFGDYECPYCGAAYLPIKQVTDKYKNDPNFNFVFREYPLPQHPNALPAAEAAEAAGAQGKYYEMHDLLYANQNDWSGSVNPTSAFEGYAQQLGLDMTKFKADIQVGKYIDRITQDQADGTALGVSGTPTFYLNGETLSGYSDLDSRIAALLAK